MLRIGITGGIGSGKSTITRIFETLGVPVYFADGAAKRLMDEDKQLREQLMIHFGPNAYKDGTLNRPYISSIVFNNKEKLELLNSLVHPVTIRDAEEWMQKQNKPYALKEAALIFESGAQAGLDYVIGVFAPAPLRILRTMKRDGIERHEVISRMQRQIEETIKMRLCDFVINNDELQLVIPQVVSLNQRLLELSKEKIDG